jgi:hypothetical protein
MNESVHAPNQPKSLREAIERPQRGIPNRCRACPTQYPNWCKQCKDREAEWVSVDVLLPILKGILKDFPMPNNEKYYEQAYTGTPVFMSGAWELDFDKWKKDVFGKADKE